MNTVLIIFGDASDVDLENELRSADFVICDNKAMLPERYRHRYHSLDASVFHQVSCDVREAWNSKIQEMAESIYQVLFTMGGCARSENSNTIKMLCLEAYCEVHLGAAQIGFINSEERSGKVKKLGRSSFFLMARALLESTVRLLFHFFRGLLLWFVCRDFVSANRSKNVSMSLGKHFSQFGDEYYGPELYRHGAIDSIILLGSLGGLQVGKFWHQIQKLRSLKRLSAVSIITDSISPIRFCRLLPETIGVITRVIWWRDQKAHSAGYKKKISSLLKTEIIASSFHLFSHMNLFGKLDGLGLFEDRSRILTYHFEFPVGRVVCALAQETETARVIGLQHGLITPGKWCYDLVGKLYSSSKTRKFISEKFFLEGEQALPILGVPRQHVQIIGPIRYRNSLDVTFDKQQREKREVLILLDLHSQISDLNAMIHLADELIPNCKLALRIHPRSMYAKKFRHLLERRYGREGWRLSTSPLPDDLRDNAPGLVVGQSSSSLLECFLMGWPVEVCRNLPNRMIIDWFIDQNEFLDGQVGGAIEPTLARKFTTQLFGENDGKAARRLGQEFPKS